jgi:hypothetical protein
MESSGDFNNTPELDYDGFIDVVRSLCGRYTPGGIEPETFSGRVRAGSICGFKTVDFSCNAHRIERMHRDVHFDVWSITTQYSRRLDSRLYFRTIRLWNSLSAMSLSSTRLGP